MLILCWLAVHYVHSLVGKTTMSNIAICAKSGLHVIRLSCCPSTSSLLSWARLSHTKCCWLFRCDYVFGIATCTVSLVKVENLEENKMPLDKVMDGGRRLKDQQQNSQRNLSIVSSFTRCEGFHVQLSMALQPVWQYSDILLSCSSCIETTKILCGQLDIRCTTCRRFD